MFGQYLIKNVLTKFSVSERDKNDRNVDSFRINLIYTFVFSSAAPVCPE